jgi:hypothetical protein
MNGCGVSTGQVYKSAYGAVAWAVEMIQSKFANGRRRLRFHKPNRMHFGPGKPEMIALQWVVNNSEHLVHLAAERNRF